jgi:hypothetical protein
VRTFGRLSLDTGAQHGRIQPPDGRSSTCCSTDSGSRVKTLCFWLNQLDVRRTDITVKEQRILQVLPNAHCGFRLIENPDGA